MAFSFFKNILQNRKQFVFHKSHIKELSDFLVNEFPQERVKHFGEGCSTAAFKVGDKIVRFPHDKNNQNVINGYKREAEICAFLKGKVSFPIPEITVFEKDGFAYASHKIIKGNTWGMHCISAIFFEKHRPLARDIAKFLSELHAIDIVEAQRLVPIRHNRFETFDVIREIIRERCFDEQLSQVEKCYNEARSLSNHAASGNIDYVLSHGDFSGRNTLIDKNNRLAGVIDFGQLAIAERITDFCLFYRGNNKKFVEEIIAEYKKFTGVEVDINRVAQLYLLRRVRRLHSEINQQHQDKDEVEVLLHTILYLCGVGKRKSRSFSWKLNTLLFRKHNSFWWKLKNLKF